MTPAAHNLFTAARTELAAQPMTAQERERGIAECDAVESRYTDVVSATQERDRENWVTSAAAVAGRASNARSNGWSVAKRVEKREGTPANAVTAIQELEAEVGRLRSLKSDLVAARERWGAIEEDKLGHYSRLLQKYPAIQRPHYTFTR